MGSKRSKSSHKKRKRRALSSGSEDSVSSEDSSSSSTTADSDDSLDKKKSKKNKNQDEDRMRGNRILLWLFGSLFNSYQTFVFLRSVFRKDMENVRSFAVYRLFDMWFYDFYNLREDFTADFLMKEFNFIYFYMYFLYIFFWFGITFFTNIKVKKYKDGDSELERRATKTAFIDEMIQTLKAKQLVILGAEFDTRAYNDMLLKNKIDAVYEVGNKTMLKKKRKILKANEFDVSHVIYVGADIDENWGKLLNKNGFDPGRPTIFVCEDLLYNYDAELAEEIVGVVSDYMEQNCNSYFVFDYYDSPDMGFLQRILSKRFTSFEIPGKKDGKRNLSKWLDKHDLHVHKSCRMERLQYGLAAVSLLEPRTSDDSSSEGSSSDYDSESSD